MLDTRFGSTACTTCRRPTVTAGERAGSRPSSPSWRCSPPPAPAIPAPGANGDGLAQATTTTAVALQPLEQPASRCGTATTKATLVRFQAADGTSLNGVMVGRGPAGVVLVHQYPSDLCGFWPFADYLAKRGLRAFAIDLRCFGRSACPEGDAKGRVVDDLDAAVAELHRRGATRVGLVGASMGGAAVLIAGTRVQAPGGRGGLAVGRDVTRPAWSAASR